MVEIRHVLVLGGTSDIAHAYAAIRAREGVALVIAGRDGEALERNAEALRGLGAASVAVVTADLADCGAIASVFTEITDRTPAIDEVVLAYAASGEDGDVVATVTTNVTSAALWLELIAAHMERIGSGRIVVVGSISGDRGRQSNYLYGATKAALERITEGLAHRLAGTNVAVTLIKPGWVATKMTRARDTSSPLYAKPEAVAASMARAVDRGKALVYVPWFWRPISWVVRALPRGLLHRTRL